MKVLTFAAIGLLAAAASAAPSVTVVSLSQGENGDVTVTYNLSEQAIVTAEFEVDGQPVTGKMAWRLYGDVSKVVAAGNGKKIVWRPEGAFGGTVPTEANTKVTVKAWTDANPPPVMVQDLTMPIEDKNITAYKNGRYGINYYPSLDALPEGVASRRYKTAKMPFVRIPAKDVQFWMGAPTSDPERKSGEDYHKVTLTNDYYLAVYEMTQAQFLAIAMVGSWTESWAWPYARSYPSVKTNDTGSSYNISSGKDWELCPVDCLNEFKLRAVYSAGDKPNPGGGTIVTQFRTMTGWTKADLPTEAEWEFACRAGSGDPRNVEGAELDEIAWYTPNADGRIQPVGLKKPNAWGLYDMLGNAWEICRDSWQSSTGTADAVAPVYYRSDRSQVSRGGAFDSDAASVRSASRHHGGNRVYDVGAGYPGEGCRMMIPIFN